MWDLARAYLRTWGKEWTQQAPIELLAPYYYERGAQTEARRRVVLVASVLPSPYNIDYQGLRDEIVENVNGLPISTVAGVIEALEFPQGDFHVIDLLPGSSRGRVVLDARTLGPATSAILEEYGVPTDRHLSPVPLPEGGGECGGEY